MFCTSCGARIDEAAYCATCGTKNSGNVQSGATLTRSSHTSTLSIVAFVLSFLVPIVGLVLGLMAKREIEQSKGQIGGRSLAVAAIVINIVWIVALLIWLIALAMLMAAAPIYGG